MHECNVTALFTDYHRLLVFVKVMVAVWILRKADGFGIAEEVIFEFCKVNCVNGRSDKNGFK